MIDRLLPGTGRGTSRSRRRRLVEGLAHGSTVGLICFAAAAGATQAVAQDRTEPSPAVHAASPLPHAWITYDPGGHYSDVPVQSDGISYVSGGGMEWPIFSVRLGRPVSNEGLEAELITPAGFDDYYVRAVDMEWIITSGDYSDAAGREHLLVQALAHHRPAARFRVHGDGTIRNLPSREFDRHQSCARRLVRTAIEAQMRDPQNARRRGRLRRRARDDVLAHRIAPPVETASLLLRMATLPLPANPARDVRQGLGQELESIAEPGRQLHWLSGQVREYGRAVRLQIDLRSDFRSPAARLCRELRLVRLRRTRIDSCIIEGIIDRRDGWPLTIVMLREAEAPNGAKQGESRRFNRVASLEGFVPPDNSCR